ncbi:Mg2+ transporter MgtE [Thiovulum sp. ES]|nr:Mg2+ transporter MgtE [Thiovulum sp. ES]
MKKRFIELKPHFEEWLKNQNTNSIYPSEIAYVLKNIYKNFGLDHFLENLKKIESESLGEVLLELPDKTRIVSIENLDSEILASAIKLLQSDDAVELVREIEFYNSTKARQVLLLLDIGNKAEIDTLLKYEDDQAGAWMQTEFFYAFEMENISDSIKRLKELKESGELREVYQLFIVDRTFKYLGYLGIDDLLIKNQTDKFSDILKETNRTKGNLVCATDDIKTVSHMFEDYNIQVIPVVDKKERIIGRITSDDAFEMIEEITTEQVYSMAGVNDDVEEESNLTEIIKSRAYWLGINLLTAILASLVIGIFDSTLQALIPLAILMPIVASMGGNAGTQTLTVVVRQIALGEIENGEGREIIRKEVIVSIFNGLIFAVVISIITFFWFGQYMLGVVIGISMIVNLFVAGFFGSVIPLTLRKLKIDPAIGSTVLLTTATDIFGFFVFLGLATLLLF